LINHNLIRGCRRFLMSVQQFDKNFKIIYSIIDEGNGNYILIINDKGRSFWCPLCSEVGCFCRISSIHEQIRRITLPLIKHSYSKGILWLSISPCWWMNGSLPRQSNNQRIFIVFFPSIIIFLDVTKSYRKRKNYLLSTFCF